MLLRSSRCLTIAALLLLAIPASASAETIDLFSAPTPADAAPAVAAKPAQKGSARERVTAVRAQTLSALTGSAKTAPDIKIDLFPGVAATFKIAGATAGSNGGSVIHATSGEDDDATLVASNGKVTGRVRYNGRTYSIRPAGGRLHKVTEISRADAPPPGPEVLAPGARKRSAKTWASQASAKTTNPDWDIAKIDMMYVYTAKAAAASPDILAEIDLAVAITNEAYTASGVQIQARLVKTLQAPAAYDEDTRSYVDALYDITGNGDQSSYFADARRIRDEVGADFVVLLREGGDSCGIGFVNTSPEGVDAWTYSAVSRGLCVDVDSVAHEVGHNMGLRHDRYVTKDENGKEFPKSEYNFGYVSIKGRAMDIMAYTNKCDDKLGPQGIGCDYKRLFSNPNKKVNGYPFGVKPGNKGASNGRRWLNEIRWIAQDIRPRGGTGGVKSAKAGE